MKHYDKISELPELNTAYLQGVIYGNEFITDGHSRFITEDDQLAHDKPDKYVWIGYLYTHD